MPDAPDDLGGAVAFVSAPPEPFVPPELHHEPVVGIGRLLDRPHEEGERVLAPLREVAQPVVDIVGPMPYTALQSMLDGGGPHGTRALHEGGVHAGAGRRGDRQARRARRVAARARCCQLLIEPMGGAIARFDPDATALGRRDVPWCYHALSMWMEPDAATADAHVAWATELAADMSPHTTTGVYLNYTSDTGDERVRSTFGPEKYARLVALKDKYDPANMFRLNQNIRPSATVSGPPA